MPPEAPGCQGRPKCAPRDSHPRECRACGGRVALFGAPDVCPPEDAPALPVRWVTARWQNAGPGGLAGRCGRHGPRPLRPSSGVCGPPGRPRVRRGQGCGGLRAPPRPRSLPRPAVRAPGPTLARSATPRCQVEEGGSSLTAAGRVLPGHSDSSRDPPPQSTRSAPCLGSATLLVPANRRERVA